MMAVIMLNTLWLSFFFLAFLAALWQWLSGTNPDVFSELMAASFDMANLAVEIAMGLIGVMALWLGLFRIAEHGGLIRLIARGMAPLFRRLMPEVPANHPALGSVTMNLAANFMGLDNAATPMGLKAMQDLQTLNPDPDTATNAHPNAVFELPGFCNALDAVAEDHAGPVAGKQNITAASKDQQGLRLHFKCGPEFVCGMDVSKPGSMGSNAKGVIRP